MVEGVPGHWESVSAPARSADDGAPAWAVVVLGGSGGRIRGVVGPFRTPDYAHKYAHDEGLRDWLVVPALWLTLPASQQAAGVAVL